MMDELLKQISGGVLRLYDASGEILAVSLISDDPFIKDMLSDNKYVMEPFSVNVCRDGEVCYGLIQMRNGRLTPRLTCGLVGSSALLQVPYISVAAGMVFTLPGLTLSEGQEEFNRQMAKILEKVINPKVTANVKVIRAADKVKANA